ncbi:MAG: Cof-type HAD-IIB family hydrolase [Clostridia bacterium]|nr:Cof-type HAD-IIB family hydrolase [Clostridia bacterium]
MRSINKRLIVSDCDGTLLNSKNTVDENVRRAINEYVACGGVFAVCTGRMLCSILPRVRELGLNGLVAAYQGSVIADIESGKLLRRNSLNANDCAEICAFAERYNFTCNAYSDEVLYTSIPVGDKGLTMYENVTGVKAVNIDGEMSKFVKNRGLACNKITFLVYPEDRERLYKLLQAEFSSKFDVTCSAVCLVEVSPKGDDKGMALKYIADHFGIDLFSTVAIGDNLNDLSMIKAASVGVAVGNAVDELKKGADFVAVSNNDGAVAEVIEKFGFR